MVYVFLANGFEEVEAVAPIDLLRRAGLTVQTVGVTGKTVIGGQGIAVEADIAIEEVSLADAELVLLPGGGDGTKNLYADAKLREIVQTAFDKEILIGAICAAPSIILGGMGLLKGKRAVCYPSMEDGMEGATAVHANYVIDGKIVTARGVGAALDFSCALIKQLCGEEKAKEIASEVVHYAW